jgi:hypothetical protein
MPGRPPVVPVADSLILAQVGGAENVVARAACAALSAGAQDREPLDQFWATAQRTQMISISELVSIAAVVAGRVRTSHHSELFAVDAVARDVERTQ